MRHAISTLALLALLLPACAHRPPPERGAPESDVRTRGGAFPIDPDRVIYTREIVREPVPDLENSEPPQQMPSRLSEVDVDAVRAEADRRLGIARALRGIELVAGELTPTVPRVGGHWLKAFWVEYWQVDSPPVPEGYISMYGHASDVVSVHQPTMVAFIFATSPGTRYMLDIRVSGVGPWRVFGNLPSQDLEAEDGHVIIVFDAKDELFGLGLESRAEGGLFWSATLTAFL